MGEDFALSSSTQLSLCLRCAATCSAQRGLLRTKRAAIVARLMSPVPPVQRLSTVIILITLFTLILIAPVGRRLAGLKARHFPDWAMCHNASQGQYRVKYEQVRDGARFPIERVFLQLFGQVND